MASVEEVAAVGQVLVDPGFDLTRRFRALFTLKNLGGKVIIEPPKTFIRNTFTKLRVAGAAADGSYQGNSKNPRTWWTPKPSIYPFFVPAYPYFGSQGCLID